MSNELVENPHINQSIVKQVALHVYEIKVCFSYLFLSPKLFY